MAKDPDIKRSLPQIPFPVGSLDELKALGIEGKDLRGIASCSEPDQFNRGCAMFEACDRERRGTRHEFEVYDEVKSSGEVRRAHGECWFVVARELVADKNRGFVQVVGGPGFKYKYQGSRRLHPKPVDGCIACAERKCSVYVDDEFEIECPSAKPASEHPMLKRFARVVEARENRGAQVKAQRRRVLLKDEGDDGKATT
jgi:hypothetical protein